MNSINRPRRGGGRGGTYVAPFSSKRQTPNIQPITHSSPSTATSSQSEEELLEDLSSQQILTPTSSAGLAATAQKDQHAFSSRAATANSLFTTEVLRPISESPNRGSKVTTFHIFETDDVSLPHREFAIHENLVREHSAFCRAALERDWLEAKHGLIKVHDVDPSIFEIFENWIYDKHVYVGNLKGDNRLSDQRTLAEAYLLGEMLQSTQFEDCVMDAWMEVLRKFKCSPPSTLIRRIWEQTPPRSPLRRFFVDYVVHRRGETYYEARLRKDYPNEFVWTIGEQISKEVLDGTCRPRPAKHPNPCEYHEHGKDDSCGRT